MNRTSSLPALDEVRRQLEDLVGRRLLGPLSPTEERRWAQLTTIEVELLGLRPSPGPSQQSSGGRPMPAPAF